MSWETYTHAIDELAPWAYKVDLFNWGESLLHPRILGMIRYAATRNLGTALSSNLSFAIDDQMIDGMIMSGLDFLSVSIDGATQAVYEAYRRRGDLELVLSNLRRLVKRRVELGRKTPRIEWQFVEMKHNQSQLPQARELAERIEVDIFRVIPVSLPFGMKGPLRVRGDWYPKGRPIESADPDLCACPFLYRYFVVNPDGHVSPCCRVFGERTDFGDSGRQKASEIWNNRMYTAARSHYRKGETVALPTVCDSCPAYVKRSRYEADQENSCL